MEVWMKAYYFTVSQKTSGTQVLKSEFYRSVEELNRAVEDTKRSYPVSDYTYRGFIIF